MCRRSLVFALVCALGGFTQQAWATELGGVRFGSHQGYDRVVCDFAEQVAYSVKQVSPETIELRLQNTSVAQDFFLPKLPRQVKLIASVEAFREGEQHIILEIKGKVPLTANPVELQGERWRLALDVSSAVQEEPKAAPVEQPSTEKPKHDSPSKSATPQYVPGDKPIETKFAESKPKSEPAPTQPDRQHELAHAEEPKQPEVKQSNEPAPQLTESDTTVEPPLSPDLPVAITKPIDTMKALEVLAEFFDIMGDQDAARDYARLYLDKTGTADPQKTPSSEPAQAEQQQATTTPWLLAVIAFVAGIAGGILGNRVRFKSFKIKLPKFPSFKRSPKQTPDDTHELERDLDSLERAVADEKPRKKPQVEVPKSVEEDAQNSFPDDEPPATVEAAMKESLMDRRVKRVLELSGQNKSLAEIAKELEMGQDEVKLILDLNS